MVACLRAHHAVARRIGALAAGACRSACCGLELIWFGCSMGNRREKEDLACLISWSDMVAGWEFGGGAVLLRLAVLCSLWIKTNESIRTTATGDSWRRKKLFGDGGALAGTGLRTPITDNMKLYQLGDQRGSVTLVPDRLTASGQHSRLRMYPSSSFA